MYNQLMITPRNWRERKVEEIGGSGWGGRGRAEGVKRTWKKKGKEIEPEMGKKRDR